MSRKEMGGSEFYRSPSSAGGPWNASRSLIYHDTPGNGYETSKSYLSSVTPATSTFNLPAGANGLIGRSEAAYTTSPAYTARPATTTYATAAPYTAVYTTSTGPQVWDYQDRYSPTDSVDDIITSPNLSDYSLDNGTGAGASGKNKNPKSRGQRKPSNRDEFDGPHQYLQKPPPDYIAMQDRELPHLPTNLHVQEQDNVLTRVNDRLSQCAFDFVAKYQFPIPLTQDMRPVERPQDREWTEWVYLLKRLATKRRIPARVLYNGQIKQFVTILENSLEMRHAAKHQSRPLKDDRNILQLISAGIQVAKILKDASAMDYLDQLYMETERQIHDRTASRYRKT